MVLSGFLAAALFLIFGHLLITRWGRLYTGYAFIILVGVTIAGTTIGASLQRGSTTATNGVFNAVVAAFHAL